MKFFRCCLLRLIRGFAVAGLATPVSAQLVRQANTTLVMPLNPPTTAFTTQDAFGTFSTFSAPIALATPPGETNRLFVAERAGRIKILTNLNSPGPAVTFLDLSGKVVTDGENGLLGFAFHPQYATNGYFFIFYSTRESGPLQQRVARFKFTGSLPVDSTSELVLINQDDGATNHNGGDIHFGPEGYLYIAVGDEGGGNDSFGNSQRIDLDFFSGILRIDVDRLAGNLEPNPHPSVVINGATGFANRGGYGLRCSCVEVSHQHSGTLLAESHTRRRADSAGAAGNEHYPVLEASHQDRFPFDFLARVAPAGVLLRPAA